MKIRTQILSCLLAGFAVSLTALLMIDRAAERVESFRRASVQAQSRLVVLTDLRALVRNEILEVLNGLLVPPGGGEERAYSVSDLILEPKFHELTKAGIASESVESLRQSLRPLIEHLQTAVELRADGKLAESRRQFMKAKQDFFQKEFLPQMGQLLVGQTEEVRVNSEALQASLRTLRNTLLLSSFLALVLTFILTMVVTRSIGRRLRKLEDAALQVAEGNFAIRLSDGGRDEIAVLSQAFDSMVGRLTDARQQLSEQQELLLNTAKMSALGEMAAGVAHEINTPLGAMILNAEMILQKLGPQEPTHGIISKRAQKIVQIGERIGKIIEGLKFFSRDGRQDEVEKFPIRRWIETTLDLCHERFRSHGVEVQVNSTCLETLIEGRLVQLSQVLLNLLNNSFDAIMPLSEKWIRIEVEIKDSFLQVRVIDSGPGVPAELVEKIFQPFYTTKPIGKGTGLGLSLSRGVVRGHGGELTYAKDSLRTCFVINLPRMDSERDRI